MSAFELFFMTECVREKAKRLLEEEQERRVVGFEEELFYIIEKYGVHITEIKYCLK